MTPTPTPTPAPAQPAVQPAAPGPAEPASAARLRDLEAELTEARRTIARLERARRIDALLADADAVDLEAARLLTEAAIQGMDEPDVQLAVQDLRRHKPWLFRERRGGASAMSARDPSAGASPIDQAASRAQASGDRRDLLRYLRLRRRA